MRLQKVSLPVLNTSFLETTLSPLLLVDCQEVKNWVKCGWLCSLNNIPYLHSICDSIPNSVPFKHVQSYLPIAPFEKNHHGKKKPCPARRTAIRKPHMGSLRKGHQDYRLLSPGKDRWLASQLPVALVYHGPEIEIANLLGVAKMAPFSPQCNDMEV